MIILAKRISVTSAVLLGLVASGLVRTSDYFDLNVYPFTPELGNLKVEHGGVYETWSYFTLK